jgi:hypothetical protein
MSYNSFVKAVTGNKPKPKTNTTKQNEEIEKIKKEIAENKKIALEYFEENLQKRANEDKTLNINKEKLLFEKMLENEGKHKLEILEEKIKKKLNSKLEILIQKKRKLIYNIILKNILTNSKYREISIIRLLTTITNNELYNLNRQNFDKFVKEKIRKFIINNPKNWSNKYNLNIRESENNNMYVNPGNNLSNRENINNNNINNSEIELKPITPKSFNERQKTKKLFNMLFNNSNTKNLYFGKNKYRRDMFKEELINSIENLQKNDETYKIIKSYNPSRTQLTEREKSMIKEYILLIFKKHYPKIYSRIEAENP